MTIADPTPSSADAGWQNWAGTQSCRPQEYVRARSVDEVCEVVARAANSDANVRVAGSRHSFTPLVCTDGIILDISALSGIEHVDAATHRARIRAGSTIASVGPPLWDAGCSLENQGDIDSQTLAGALSTATHGSGLRFGSISSALTRAELVTANGELVTVEEDDPRLAAIQTSVGCLGILTSVELQLIPAYQLVERTDHWPLAKVLERWEHETRTRRHFSFFWGPSDGSLELYDLPRAPPGMEEACFIKRYDEIADDATDVTSTSGRVDRAYRIYAAEFPTGWDELEYFVPYESALDALEAIRPVLAAFPQQRFPVEVRTIAAENALISPMHGRESVSLSFSGAIGTDYVDFLRGIDAALRELDGRPHWGKTHFVEADHLRDVYPRYEEFVAIRRAMDPDGLLLNDHVRGMLA
jgi:FAD/FMN-containing dehydrogenase